MMTILYKLTDQDGYTRRGFDNETLWSEGVTHEVPGDGVKLCSPDVIHAYSHPIVALMMNPAHADIRAPRLWECEGDIVADDAGRKCGVKRLTVIREIEVPQITTEHRVRFAILCALEVYPDTGFSTWASKWLSGEDRSQGAAEAARAAVAEAAVVAAMAAAWAAEAAEAAAVAAARAARAAADAAIAAARAAAAINLPVIAMKALEIQ